MANENTPLNGITPYNALLDAKTHLDLALAGDALKIGRVVDSVDYEHLKIAQRLVQLRVEANRG